MTTMNKVPSHHPKYRTKLCRNFVSGNCPFGQKCSFLHPPPGILPPSAPIAQQLLNWNLLLPQLLALSSQQGTKPTMTCHSPPLPQRPQLIDEDPSPSSSLLLSTSDCTSSEQMPETRTYTRRNKYPCRHFVRTNGWCPAGDQCKFYHDLSAVQSISPETDLTRPLEPDVYGDDGRTISGGVLMGVRPPSPPNVSEQYPQFVPSHYPAAELPQPYQDYRAVPAYWPSQPWPQYPVYYTPAYSVPVTTAVPATAAPHSTMQYMSCPQPPPPPPPPPVQAQPPSEYPKGVSTDTYELNGTTYFLPSVPPPPPPPPASYVYPIPHPAPYSHMIPPPYAYHPLPPPPPPPLYHNAPEQAADYRPTFFDPFASDPMVPSELPVIPRLQDYNISPILGDTPPLPLASEPKVDLESMQTDSQTSTEEHEFPYRPPKNQRVGHARRISVNIKKHSLANSG